MDDKLEIAEVRSSCGRHYLSVAGIVVAMEGDKCRDGGLLEEAYAAIPPEELAQASIGGKPASELPIDVVRFFRGDHWSEALLQAAADQINRAHHAR